MHNICWPLVSDHIHAAVLKDCHGGGLGGGAGPVDLMAQVKDPQVKEIVAKESLTYKPPPSSQNDHSKDLQLLEPFLEVIGLQ